MTSSDGTDQPTGDLTDRASRFDRLDFRSRDPAVQPAPPPPATSPGAATAGSGSSRVPRFDRADFGLARAAVPPAVSFPQLAASSADGGAPPSEEGPDADAQPSEPAGGVT